MNAPACQPEKPTPPYSDSRRGRRLLHMRFIGFDLETSPFAPGNMAPRVATCQWLESGFDAEPQIATRRGGAVEHARRFYTDPETVVVGHNVAYDSACLTVSENLAPEVFAAYDAGRVRCTWAYERLGEIAGLSTRKQLDLDTCCRAHGLPAAASKHAVDEATGLPLALGFEQFADAEDVPDPWRTYGLDDCRVLKLAQRQHRRFQRDVPDSAWAEFSRLQFACQLMSVRGLRTSEHAIETLRANTAVKLAELRPLAERWGFLRANGTRDMARIKAAVAEAYGAECPRTPTGQPQTSAMVLERSEDAALCTFAHYGELLKLESTDLPLLSAGILHPRYGLADTGRTTCSKPNVQNLPGKSGARECVVPREGFAFIDADYAGVELCTFAQVCAWLLRDVRMCNQINSSGDPGWLHAVLGARLARLDDPREFLRRVKAKEPGYPDIRTRAKNANFGFMGGMGWRKFIDYVWALSKGAISLDEAEARALRAAWGEANPCGPAYLDFVGLTDLGDGRFEAEIPGFGILRRGLWYSAAANSRFQGLAAAVMSKMLWALTKACWLSELRGCHLVGFVHDQVLVEAPVRDVHEVDLIVTRIMRDAAAEVLSDVLTKVESCAAACYSKNSSRVVDEKGRLLVWTP